MWREGDWLLVGSQYKGAICSGIYFEKGLGGFLSLWNSEYEMTYGGIWWGCILFSFECHFFWSLLSSAESFRAKFIKQNVFGPGMYAEVVSNHFYGHRMSQKIKFWPFMSDNLPYLWKQANYPTKVVKIRCIHSWTNQTHFVLWTLL